MREETAVLSFIQATFNHFPWSGAYFPMLWSPYYWEQMCCSTSESHSLHNGSKARNPAWHWQGRILPYFRAPSLLPLTRSLLYQCFYPMLQTRKVRLATLMYQNNPLRHPGWRISLEWSGCGQALHGGLTLDSPQGQPCPEYRISQLCLPPSAGRW